MQIFLSAFDDVADPRASNARHYLGELLVTAVASVLCGSRSCAEMAAFGRSKKHLFSALMKPRHAIPSHDTFSEVFRMIDPKALDAAIEVLGLIALRGKVVTGDALHCNLRNGHAERDGRRPKAPRSGVRQGGAFRRGAACGPAKCPAGCRQPVTQRR